MDTIRQDLDKEELLEDSQKLKMFEKDMKFGFYKNIDSLHMEFLTEHNEIQDVDSIQIIKKVFDFLKSKA